MTDGECFPFLSVHLTIFCPSLLVLFFVSQMKDLMSKVIEADASKNKNRAVKYILLKYARNMYF